jgi:hypothetical protein
MRVDLQTQSQKHFGRTTYDLNGQIKVFSSPSKLVLQKVDVALVNFRGICSRANLKKMPFVFWHMSSKNVDKLLQIVGIFWGTASRQPERHLPNEDLH